MVKQNGQQKYLVVMMTKEETIIPTIQSAPVGWIVSIIASTSPLLIGTIRIDSGRMPIVLILSIGNFVARIKYSTISPPVST